MASRKDKDITIGKRLFLRMLAQETGLTLENASLFWDAVVRVFVYILASGKILNISGFGRLKIVQIPPFEGWDGIKKKRYIRKPGQRMSIVLHGKFKRNYKDYLESKEEMNNED